jgi:hypothetical protein
LLSFSEVSSLLTIGAWIAKATMLLVVAGCSLTPQRETSSPVAWESRTPRSVIETAFASLNAASTDAGVIRPKAQGSCNELESLFLNPRCSKMHKKQAWVRHHRVATFIVGRTGTNPSMAAAPSEPEPLSEPVPRSNGIKTDLGNIRSQNVPQLAKANENPEGFDKGEYLKTTCAKAWPYYDQACMLKYGNAQVVRVIDLDRQLRAGDGKRAAP